MKLCIHWYHQIRNTGKWSYRQCRCGKRKIVQVGFGGYQPVCGSWIETGEFTKSPVPSSLIKPSDAGRSAKPPLTIRSYDW